MACRSLCNRHRTQASTSRRDSATQNQGAEPSWRTDLDSRHLCRRPKQPPARPRRDLSTRSGGNSRANASPTTRSRGMTFSRSSWDDIFRWQRHPRSTGGVGHAALAGVLGWSPWVKHFEEPLGSARHPLPVKDGVDQGSSGIEDRQTRVFWETMAVEWRANTRRLAEYVNCAARGNNPHPPTTSPSGGCPLDKNERAFVRSRRPRLTTSQCSAAPRGFGIAFQIRVAR